MKTEIKAKLVRNGKEQDLQIIVREEIFAIYEDEEGQEYMLRPAGGGGLGSITA